MEIKLFDDQERSINLLRQSLARNKSVMLQGETGSGKSVMASYMLSGSLKKGLRCAFIVPRKDLLYQMTQTFKSYDIEHSFVAAGHPFNPFSQMHLCSLGTLINRLDKINPQVVFIDEAHHASNQLGEVIAHYKKNGAWIIGLSATPEYPKGQSLDAHYDDLIQGPSVRELINMKRLSDYKLYSPSRPDFSKISIVAGDYAKGQIADFMEHDKVLIGDAVRQYKQVANGNLNLSFCTSIKHSHLTVEDFKNAGIPSVHMDGETPENERRQIARAYANHELLNICSVDLLCFGYDLAAASGIKTAVIESMSDLAPTMSRRKQRQKYGRVLRYKDYPASISDHAGNVIKCDGTENQGFPCKEVQWSLKGEKKGTREGVEKAVAVQSCSKCYWTAPPWGLKCPNCGDVREVQSREIEHIEGELVELDKNAIMQQKKEARQEQGKARTLQELIAHGKKMGYAAGWAFKIYSSRKGKR